MFRFAGFELDPQRATLRGCNGEAIKLRPKTFDMLRLFAANPGRVLSKQELLETIWPTVRIGEDGLFQCVREIRAALGDDQRQLLKLVSGRGYVFDVAVAAEPGDNQAPADSPAFTEPLGLGTAPVHARPFRFLMRAPMALVTAVGLVGLAVAAPIFAPNLTFNRTLPSIAVMPIDATGGDPQTAAMAAGVTERLIDGLAKIDNIRVVLVPASTNGTASSASYTRPAQVDYVVNAELRKGESTWTVLARMVKTSTSTVYSVEAGSVDITGIDRELQQSRLTAALGHPLALRINALLHSEGPIAGERNGATLGSTKAVITQAIASINQTTRERFAAAKTMLESALAEDADNVDLAVALAALQLRGIQMVWYSPAEAVIAENNARAVLERALHAAPNNIPVLEAYCRFLSTTNEFVESLVACAHVLDYNPWSGQALFHLGIAEVQLGRFDDALASFKYADRIDTPKVSRWTWLLGAGMTYALMGRNEEALSWLQRSIAITPGTGRSHLLLAAAYQQLGRTKEAKAAFEKALELRPNSNVENIKLPSKNSSPVFIEASVKIRDALIELGLPQH